MPPIQKLARADLLSKNHWRRMAQMPDSRSADFETPRLFFMTDPTRIANIAAILARLPARTGVIFRHFGQSDPASFNEIRRLCDARQLPLFVSWPAPEFMRRDGVHYHLPERTWRRLRRIDVTKLRIIRRGKRMVSAAAHSPDAVGRAFFADIIVYSAIFPSQSARARGKFRGLMRAALIARRFRQSGITKPTLIGLGGINAQNARRVLQAGFDGVGAISGLVRGSIP